MKKVIALAAVVALTACAEKPADMPAADTTTTAPATPAPADSMQMPADSTMPRDSAHTM